MGLKYDNLKKLNDRGLNTHEYVNVTTFNELLDYAKENGMISIRFDRNSNISDLPFYTLPDEKHPLSISNPTQFLTEIAQKANDMNCSMLLANGKKYDEIQTCNFVIFIKKNGDFVLEWCTEKVPVRRMYEYTTSVLKGNVMDNIKDMQWIRKDKNIIDKRDIEDMISWALKTNIFDENLECTLYPIKVGKLNERIVCWQRDESATLDQPPLQKEIGENYFNNKTKKL